ncbi:sulfatase [Tamlana fucoidanivorans]|uniref:Sulfatase n=2 Tax=Allotamlana fucoidanivorans TaxID=2583814 RepID=A0A5C4SQE2_9FLAO|nr:sulfatase [Tamlana fucoidanivorans]
MILIVSCLKKPKAKEAKQHNILFIAIDDLRPDLGIYNNTVVKSPNLDAIGNEGVVFNNHFVTAPTCGASRAGLLTGLLPRDSIDITNEVFSEKIAKQKDSPKTESFVHFLRQKGYYTVGVGKISHSPDGLIYGYGDEIGTEWELPKSWDEMLLDLGNWGTGWNSFFAYSGGKNRTDENKNLKPYEKANVSDEGYPDGLILKTALKKLNELSEKKEPFFLGVGFFKPHLPFNSPKKYWDLYDRNQIKTSPNPEIPKNVNLKSLHSSHELNQYKKGEEKASLQKPLSEHYSKKLIHAYYASISYIDNQVGKLMTELEQLGLSDNTIIILWGDHGWHLGDHRIWGKHTLFERSLKSTFIIKAPQIKKGSKVNEIVSSIDLYPTLMELCGFSKPNRLDGQSLVPLLKFQSPDWSNVAYSYYNRGISVRNERFRLTKYFRENEEEPNIELYDHINDPNETTNIAKQEPMIVQKLLKLIDQGDFGIYKNKN